MKMINNQKGFTLIELVLVVVVLGILAAFATIRFGTLVTDAKMAAIDGSKAPFTAQLAVAISTLKTLPTTTQFGTEVHAMVVYDGDVFKGKYDNGKFQLNTGKAACKSKDGEFKTTGSYNDKTGVLSFSAKEAC